MPTEDVQRLVHEFQVHQIELELQGEELRGAMAENAGLHADLYEQAPVGYVTLNRKGGVLAANVAACDLFGRRRANLIGARFAGLISPDSQDAWHFHWQRLLASRGRRTAQVKVKRTDGAPLDIRLESSPANSGSGEWYCRTALIDVTEQVRTEERLRGMVEHLPAGAVYVDHDKIYLNAAAEELTGYGREELPTVNEWFAKLFAPSVRHQHDVMRADGFSDRSPALSLRRKDGQERVVEYAGHVFDDHEIWLIYDLTERKRLEQEVVNVCEEERIRIAADLHDGLGSLLTGVSFRLRALVNRMNSEDNPQGEEAGNIADLIVNAIAQTRELARGLYPIGDASGGLLTALENLVNLTRSSCNGECQFKEPDRPLPVLGNVELNTLYRIAQEALNNAVKHSQATALTVALEVEGKHVILRVEDNGTGFDPSDNSGDGLGLRLMAHRANLVGGEFAITRRPGGGTMVKCVLPTTSA